MVSKKLLSKKDMGFCANCDIEAVDVGGIRNLSTPASSLVRTFRLLPIDFLGGMVNLGERCEGWYVSKSLFEQSVGDADLRKIYGEQQDDGPATKKS